MNNIIVVQLLIAGVIYGSRAAQTEDYCWREFEGTVPADALTAGSDKKSQPVYIAQVLFQDKLVPGKVHDGNKVYFDWYDLKDPRNLNVKILSSKQSQKLEWIPVQKDKPLKLASNVLVKGGHEQHYPTYIGRVVKGGEASIGKVVCSKNSCGALYTASNGSYQAHETFEILTYNPQIDSIDHNCDPLIDIRMGP